MDLIKKTRYKVKNINLRVDVLRIDPTKLCKNCGKLIGGHYKIKGRDYCYVDPDDFDIFEQNIEYWSDV